MAPRPPNPKSGFFRIFYRAPVETGGRNTKKTKFPGCRAWGKGSWLRKHHQQHASGREVPVSQLAARGPRQHSLPTVASILRGNNNVSRSKIFKKLIFQKIQDSTPIQRLFKDLQSYFIKMYDARGFTYGLRLSAIMQDLLRFHHHVVPFFLNDRD